MLGIGFKLSDTSTSSLRSSLRSFLQREYASETDTQQSETQQTALDQFVQLKADVDLFQVHCMRAATQYWQGTASKAVALARGEGYGEEITRLAAADAECNEACKVATQNKLPASLLQSAQSLQRVELGGVDLFEQFVPKDLLQTAEKVSKSNEAAKEKLHSMGLPASIEAFEKTNDNGIPHTIWQRIQYVKVTTASAAMGPGGSKQNPVAAFIQQQLEENQRMCDEAEKNYAH
eukprot:jgi/Phyca11/537506/estExt2_fgenesh1_pg.C_PHYCAscaffold_950002